MALEGLFLPAATTAATAISEYHNTSQQRTYADA